MRLLWFIYFPFILFLFPLVSSVAENDNGDDADNQYLIQEFGRVLRSKYESVLDNPLTAEGKEEIDRIFASAAPLFHPAHEEYPQDGHAEPGRRSKRAAHEEKEEQLSLDGVIDFGSIPVDFSREICMFQVEGLEYAAVVHSTNISNLDNSTRLLIFRMQENQDFVRIYNISLPYIVGLDCISFNQIGFVSAAVNLNAANGNTHLYSPVFRIEKGDHVEIIEKNTWKRIRTANLWKFGNDLFLMYTFFNDPSYDLIPGAYFCPIFKYSGNIFENRGEIPCSNAIRIQSFSIASDLFLAVANSRDMYNNTEVNTIIYKFDLNLDKFVSFQNILVNKIVDLRHFSFKLTEDTDNFLVITSATLIDSNEVAEIHREGYSVIMVYKYVEELFLPMQNIPIEKPTQVLPHIWQDKELVLLIASQLAPVQFYQYHGWKFEVSNFEERPIAFESGVNSLRNYNTVKGDSLILLANSEHFGSIPNLFKVHFKVDQNSNLYNEILQWCEKSVEDLQAFDYDKVLNQLEEIKEQQKAFKDELVLDHELILRNDNVTIEEVIADQVEDSETAQMEEEHNALIGIQEVVVGMQRKLEKFQEIFEKSMSKDTFLRSSDDQEIAFDVLQVQHIETQFVNGKPVELYGQSDGSLLVESLNAEQITVHGTLQLESHKDVLPKALRMSGDQLIEFPIMATEIEVENLTCRESINDNDIKAITTALEQMANSMDDVSVDHVTVNNLRGLVNGKDFSELDRLILKTIGDQVITGWTTLENLVVGGNAEILGNVGGHSMSELVTITGEESKELILNRAVHFTNTPIFHDLKVKERIGSVAIKRNGAFDVLMKNVPYTQIMQGEATFDQVRLLEPITLHGKIPNSPLNKMNPNVVVEENVELTGNYEIRGPVSVKRMFKTQDLLPADQERSLGDLKNFGIKLNQDVIEGDLVFHQPIKVQNTIANSIKNIRTESLLRSGLNGGSEQVVTARKTFNAPLVTVHGQMDTGNVNGIEVEDFARNILTKTGDQTIQGNVHFNKINSFSSTADFVSIGGRDIRSLFASDKRVVIPGQVELKGILKPINELHIETLIPNGTVFGYNFTKLRRDTLFRGAKDAKVKGKKIFMAKLNVRQMKTDSDFGTLSKVPLDGVLRLEVNEDLVLTQVNARNVFVHHEINGIPVDQFGTSWLTLEGNQIFSQHQTIRSFHAERLSLFGGIEQNGSVYDINNSNQNTYWKNREEIVEQSAVFENQLVSTANLHILGSLGGLRVPEDLILRNASHIDVLSVKSGDVTVDNGVIVNGRLNEVALGPLFNFTLNENAYLPANLKVMGRLEFLREPLIEHLGNTNIESLYENAWMLYHSRDILGDMSFEELHLGADVIAEIVNSRNLPHFVANRFSLREPQRVVDKLHFVNEVVTHGECKIGRLHSGDAIKLSNKNNSVNVKYFSENSLLKDTGSLQSVKGNWHFQDLSIEGDLQNVLINGLNLVEDVVRRDSPGNVVYGGRGFDNLHIVNLDCNQFCYVQGVNLNSWMMQVVYLEGDQTVQGDTILESPEILRNLRVFGSVNGQAFGSDQFLCKGGHQYMNVSLHVNNQFDERLHPLVVQSLDTDQVNGHRIWQDQMDESVLVSRRMGAADVVDTPVTFHEKLVVENLNLEGETLFGARVRDVQLNMGMRRLLDEQTKGLTDLLRIVDRATQQSAPNEASPKGLLHLQTNGRGRYVKHFKVLQRIPGRALKYLQPLRRFPGTRTNAANATTSTSIFDHLLIKIDGGEPGQLGLLGYNASLDQFLGVSTIDFVRDVVALQTLSAGHDGREVVFLQTRPTSREPLPPFFWNHLLEFDGATGQFKLMHEFQSHPQIRVEMLNTDKGDVLVQYAPLMDAVELFEVKWLRERPLQERGRIAKRGVVAVLALDKNFMALLLDKRQVEIWRFNTSMDSFEQQFVLPGIEEPVALASCPFRGHRLIAVQSLKNVVDIFILVDQHKLVHYQTLQIPDPILQLRFVQMTSEELMLVLSTTNERRPLVVYRYAGLSLFVERLGFSELGLVGHRISDLIIDDGQQPRNFMIMVADTEAVILEAITEQ